MADGSDLDVELSAKLASLSALDDQVAATLRGFARSLGAYYRQLVEEDIPQRVVAELLGSYHDLYWGSIYPAKTTDAE